MKAWVFLKLTPSKTAAAIREIRRVEGVRSADAVTGPWDGFVLVEAEDLRSLGQTVLSQVGAVDGVEDTLINLVFES
jgi:DNA-binding Lrp family transcriptional regulator